METYVLKTILASSLFIGFYYLFLEKEKTFRFNRFYLLSSLMLSFVLPLIKIEVQPEIIVGQPELLALNSEAKTNEKALMETKINWQTIILVLYAVGSFFMLFKLVFGFVKMNSLKGETIIYKGIKTKILEKVISPFSFLNTLYIGKIYFTDGKMNEAIFLHEKNHIKSKHSLDLLFVEICKIVMWFNPAVYLYKKALVDNHEFSADETVINTSQDIKNYQHLILSEIEFQQKFNFSNHFYFNNTKKRIIMMSKRKNPIGKWKNALSLPLLAGIAFFTVQKVSATAVTPASTQPSNNTLNEKQEVKDVPQTVSEKIFEKVEIPTSPTVIKTDTVRPTKPEKSITPPKSETPPLPAAKNVQKNEADVAPNYPGGIGKFRELFVKEFDNSKVNIAKDSPSKIVRAEVKFTVNAEGVVENVDVSSDNVAFGNETKRAVEKIANVEKWIPAQKDGKNVKAAFKFPLTMQFE